MAANKLNLDGFDMGNGSVVLHEMGPEDYTRLKGEERNVYLRRSMMPTYKKYGFLLCRCRCGTLFAIPRSIYNNKNVKRTCVVCADDKRLAPPYGETRFVVRVEEKDKFVAVSVSSMQLKGKKLTMLNLDSSMAVIHALHPSLKDRRVIEMHPIACGYRYTFEGGL